MNQSSPLRAVVVRAVGGDDGPWLDVLAEECGLSFASERELRRAGRVVLVAEEAGTVVGFVALQLLVDEAEILDLGVRSDRRRLGIGHGLLRAAGEELRSRGGSRLLLEVRRGNLPAIRLYEQMGFELVGERKRYYQGGEDALIFAWVLAD
jgi:ribosomal-protein-alanine N-acetyltransferase